MFKAHRLFYHSNLGSRVSTKKTKKRLPLAASDPYASPFHSYPILEATQGQINGFLSQLPYKCHLPEVASVGH